MELNTLLLVITFMNAQVRVINDYLYVEHKCNIRRDRHDPHGVPEHIMLYPVPRMAIGCALRSHPNVLVRQTRSCVLRNAVRSRESGLLNIDEVPAVF